MLHFREKSTQGYGAPSEPDDGTQTSELASNKVQSRYIVEKQHEDSQTWAAKHEVEKDAVRLYEQSFLPTSESDK